MAHKSQMRAIELSKDEEHLVIMHRMVHRPVQKISEYEQGARMQAMRHGGEVANKARCRLCGIRCEHIDQRSRRQLRIDGAVHVKVSPVRLD